MIIAIDPSFALLNRWEAGLWGAIGAGMVIAAIVRRGPARLDPTRRDCILAAGAFLAFGLSDVVEATTGAWWRPWWLFAWKAACVLVFLILLIRHVRRRRSGDHSS